VIFDTCVILRFYLSFNFSSFELPSKKLGARVYSDRYICYIIYDMLESIRLFGSKLMLMEIIIVGLTCPFLILLLCSKSQNIRNSESL